MMEETRYFRYPQFSSYTYNSYPLYPHASYYNPNHERKPPLSYQHRSRSDSRSESNSKSRSRYNSRSKTKQHHSKSRSRSIDNNKHKHKTRLKSKSRDRKNKKSEQTVISTENKKPVELTKLSEPIQPTIIAYSSNITNKLESVQINGVTVTGIRYELRDVYRNYQTKKKKSIFDSNGSSYINDCAKSSPITINWNIEANGKMTYSERKDDQGQTYIIPDNNVPSYILSLCYNHYYPSKPLNELLKELKKFGISDHLYSAKFEVILTPLQANLIMNYNYE